jgi:hypothetical protein
MKEIMKWWKNGRVIRVASFEFRVGQSDKNLTSPNSATLRDCTLFFRLVSDISKGERMNNRIERPVAGIT